MIHCIIYTKLFKCVRWYPLFHITTGPKCRLRRLDHHWKVERWSSSTSPHWIQPNRFDTFAHKTFAPVANCFLIIFLPSAPLFLSDADWSHHKVSVGRESSTWKWKLSCQPSLNLFPTFFSPSCHWKGSKSFETCHTIWSLTSTSKKANTPPRTRLTSKSTTESE